MEQESKVTCWSVKYLFTKGIERVDGHTVDPVQGQSNYVRSGIRFERIGRDAFMKRDDAVARAKVLCDNKLKALEKQRVKIEKLLATLVNHEST